MAQASMHSAPPLDPRLSSQAMRQQASDAAHESVSHNGTIAAIIDNQAREVGAAVLDPSRLWLGITQFVEPGASAPTITTHILAVHDVVEVVVLDPPAGAVPTQLMRQLAPLLPDCVSRLPRTAFDDGAGREALEAYCTPESWAQAQRIGNTGMYLAMSAASALLHQLLQDGRQVLRAGQLHLEVMGTSAHLQLSPGAVECLEILPRPGARRGWVTAALGAATQATPARPAGFLRAPNFKPHLASRSLYDAMNHTRTSVGARLLRAALVQPLIDVDAIEARYDVAQELQSHHQLRLDVSKVLGQLPKRLDALCSSLAMQPAGSMSGRPGARLADPGKRISACISAVLLLRAALEAVPALAAALQPSRSALLRAMHTTCSLPDFAVLLGRINEVMEPDATTSTSPFVNRIQQCFAVKSGADKLLDVARTSFCRVTDQVHELAERYAREGAERRLHIKVSYTDRHGFYLAVSRACAPGRRGQAPDGDSDASIMQAPPGDVQLPRGFQRLEKRGRGSVAATTPELGALNARLRDMAHDCLLLTEQVMDGLVAHLVGAQPLLLRLVDNVALLDMLAAFAAFAAPGSSNTTGGGEQDQVQLSFCRPRLLAHGHALRISEGRHPLLLPRPGAAVTANHTAVDGDTASLHIITGPNLAGKSTYLRQVGLLVVMAQAGCLVPAEAMSLRPLTSLLTRLDHRDCLEANASSFCMEMQDVACILDRAGPRSLVLIDELGRGTSTSDGTGVCWAVAEALLASRALTLFATHFAPLAQLAAVYPQARLWGMQVDVCGERVGYKWRLAQAPPTARPGAQGGALPWSYGLALATTLGLPEHLVAEARRVSQHVAVVWAARAPPLITVPGGAADADRRVFDLAGRLMALAVDAIRATQPRQAGQAPPFADVVHVASGDVEAGLECGRETEQQEGRESDGGFWAPAAAVKQLAAALCDLQPEAVSIAQQGLNG